MAGFLSRVCGQIKVWIQWSWTYLWAVWFMLVVFVIYILRGPLKLSENVSYATMFLNTLTPKFYVALTGTSSLISGLILIFEWWYFKKYGTSFIEQVSLNHISPLLGGEPANGNENVNGTGTSGNSNGNSNGSNNSQGQQKCKVWRNPLNLFRGAEYLRFTWKANKDPLTYYDMNLSAQDHQTFFTCDADAGKPEYEIMQTAWRERKPQARIKAANEALEKNPECSTALILLAEEDASTILDAEKLFKQAYKYAEVQYKKSQQIQHQGQTQEAIHRRDTNVMVYIKRRLAMCARKLGRIREAVKLMREIMKEFPMLSMFNIHENLIEALLELQAYADVQVVLAKYDDISLPKSATICYTAALLKARAVADKFSPDIASKRGLSTAEMSAVEAIHRAVEFNPHVPKYLLEMKSLVLPPEHILKRGDSEALAYAFFHLHHWKRIDGALNLLHCTWEGSCVNVKMTVFKTCLQHLDENLTIHH
ncbi:Suppressor of tumorigenicity 7 protein [Mactra antiquata]